VKEAGSKAGLQLDGGVGCICPSARAWKDNNGTPTEYLMKGLRVSKAIGATAMRCYMGDSGDRLGSVSIDQHIENTVKALKTVRALALDLGVKIGVENHSGDMQAGELKTLIEEAGKDYVGACLDTGNPMWVMEDPLLTLEVLGPYTVTTHIRDSVVFEHPRGAAAQWVALGDGIVDFKKFVPGTGSSVRMRRCSSRTSPGVLRGCFLTSNRTSGRRFRKRMHRSSRGLLLLQSEVVH
jgi:3-oxoisoapionate decarboxylase